MNLKLSRNNITNKGIHPLDIYDGPLPDDSHFTFAEGIILGNYGIEAGNKVRNDMIWQHVRNEKWSLDRFRSTLDTFIKSNVYPAFSVADFLKYADKQLLYGKKWYEGEIQKNPDASKKMDIYEVDGSRLYRYHDGEIFKNLRVIQVNGELLQTKRAILEKKLNQIYADGKSLAEDIEYAKKVIDMKKMAVRAEYRGRMSFIPVAIRKTFREFYLAEKETAEKCPEKLAKLRLEYKSTETELKTLIGRP